MRKKCSPICLLSGLLLLSFFSSGVADAAQTVGPPAPPSLQQTLPLDLNTASRAQLLALPAMGPAYVDRILSGRPYTAKNQLTQRGILPAAAYERIKNLVVAHRIR